jgi:hypothetical protein
VNCQICGKDIGNVVVVVPKPRPGGYLDSMACIECAKKSGMYCEVHERPHQGFSDGTSSCRVCQKELYDKHRSRASLLAGMIQDAVPREDFAVLLEEWAWAGVTDMERDILILLHLCAASLGRKMDLDELVRQIVVSHSLDIIKLKKSPAL